MRTGLYLLPLLMLLASCAKPGSENTAATAADPVDAFPKLCSFLARADSAASEKALRRFFSEISADTAALREVAKQAELRLNNPASPVRNESSFISIATALLAANNLPSDIRDRVEEHLRLASLNRPGTIATDFNYVDRHGNRSNLHSLQSEQTMVVFYDPECPHCMEILDKLAANPRINAAIANKELTVLAIYTEGKTDVWKNALDEMPPNWLVGCDQSGIVENDLYNLPAMPIVYLLDSEKRVILKDPNTNTL